MTLLIRGRRLSILFLALLVGLFIGCVTTTLSGAGGAYGS